MVNWKKALKHLCITALLLLPTGHLHAQCDWDEVTTLRRSTQPNAQMDIDVNQNLILTWRKFEGFGIGDTFVDPPASLTLNAFTASVDPDYNVNWVVYYVDHVGESCLLNPSHVLGENGDIYLIGQIDGTCSFIDTSFTYVFGDDVSLLLKLDSLGNIQWKRTIDYDFAYDQAFLNRDTILYLYSQGGQVQLIHATTGADLGGGVTMDIFIDQIHLGENGNVLFSTLEYDIGNSILNLGQNTMTVPLVDHQALVVRYNLDTKTVLWYDALYSGDLFLKLSNVQIGPDGNHYVAGNFRDTLGLLNSGFSFSQPGYMGNFIIKYNVIGVMQWVKILNMRLTETFLSDIRIVNHEQSGLYFAVDVKATTDILGVTIPLTGNGSAVYGQLDQDGNLLGSCNITAIGSAQIGGVYQNYGSRYFTTFIRGVAYIGNDTVIQTTNGHGSYAILKIDSLLNTSIDYSKAQEKESDLKVFPNPTSNTLWVDIGKREDVSIEYYSIIGTKLYHQNIKNHLGNSEIKIDATGLSPGTYFLKVADKHRTIMRKFVVCK